MITSKDNERIKFLRKLKSNKYIKENKKFIIEGFHLIEEALKKNIVLEIFVLEDKVIDIDFNNITYVTKEVMKSITFLESVTDVIALCKIEEENKDIGKKVVILNGVQDPGNVGTIIRNCVAFNIDTLILDGNSVNKYNEKLLRATQGMFFHLNIIEMDIKEAIRILKERNIKIYSTTLSNSKDLYEIKREKNYAFIFGNEGSGITEEVLNVSDYLVRIKMNPLCESLNVGVSSGIILSYMESNNGIY